MSDAQMGARQNPEQPVVILKRAHLQTAAIVFAGLALGGILFLLLKPILPFRDNASGTASQPDSMSWFEAQRFNVSVQGRPSIGSNEAPVTIVEFTDYGCGVCRRHASEVLPALLDSLGSEIHYVVRHFPIPALTPNGMAAAIAAECAHEQGRFFEYKAAISNGAGGFGNGELLAHAREIGLGIADFEDCIGAGDARRDVERDILDGWVHGVTGTPTFFINGRRFQGARPLEQLVEFVRLAGLETDSSPAISQ